jgi:hypothetical protein
MASQRIKLSCPTNDAIAGSRSHAMTLQVFDLLKQQPLHCTSYWTHRIEPAMWRAARIRQNLGCNWKETCSDDMYLMRRPGTFRPVQPSKTL